VIWCGARFGVWPTTVVATAGTVAAALVDHRVFVPLVARAAARRGRTTAAPWPERMFRRYPFAIIALSGVTPLPFFPVKALAFAVGYPMGRYAAAVAARSLPRYALLAWLGAAVRLPIWAMIALFAVLMIPSLRIVWCRPPRAAS
jgi:ribonucleoside-triphosphate reductase